MSDTTSPHPCGEDTAVEAAAVPGSHRAATAASPDPIDIDDCDLVYSDPIDDESILTDLDLNNDCSNPGGHLWLVHGRDDVRCVHCDKPAMPVYASREAE